MGLALNCRESTHREAFDQHLHSDELLVNGPRLDDLVQEVSNRRTRLKRCAPACSDVIREAGDVSRFFSCLVGSVFLCARVAKNLRQARGQGQRALLAMQDAREDEARILIRESDFLPFVQPICHGRLQLDAEIGRHDQLLSQVERLRIEVDITFVRGIPEMVDGRGDDRVEGIRSFGIAVDFDQAVEIVAVDGVVDRVIRDVTFAH